MRFFHFADNKNSSSNNKYYPTVYRAVYAKVMLSSNKEKRKTDAV